MTSNVSWKVKLDPIDTSSSLHESSRVSSHVQSVDETGESSSLGSDQKNNLVQYFYEPTDGRVKHTNLKRFPSNKNLHATFDEKSVHGLLGRQKSSKYSLHKSPTHSRRLSWMSTNTFDLSQPLLNILDINEIIGEKFKILLKPPKFDRDDLLFSIHTFMSSIIDFIPAVKLDKTYSIFKEIRMLLKSSECLRLYGLLIHFCYWNIIHPAARNAIKEVKKDNKRKNSFIDIELTDGSQFLIQLAQNRVGLLPEILEDEGEHHLNYDEENISPKHRHYSFNIVNQMNQGIPIQSALHNHNASRNSVMSAVTFASSGDSYSVGGGGGAKTIEQLDDLFNRQLENIGEEGEDDLSLASSKMTSSTGAGDPVILAEQTTNIPFSAVTRDRLGIETNMERGDSVLQSQNQSQNGSVLPWLNGGDGNGSVGGVSLSSETSLTFHEREQLFIQLETCITTLFKKMGRGKFALVTGRQALISCCHYIVDDILTAMYPWFAQVQEEYKPPSPSKRSSPPISPFPLEGVASLQGSLKQLNLRLRRLVHQSVSDLIDPSRIYTSSMLLNLVLGLGNSKSIKEVARKAKELLENEHHGGRRGKYYRTSAAVLALFGDTHSPLARKFLQRSATLYTQIPGAVEPFVSKLDNVGEWEEPLEYFNTVKEEELKEKQLKETMRITEREKDQTEVQRIARKLARSSSTPIKLSEQHVAPLSNTEQPFSPPRTTTSQFRSPLRLQQNDSALDAFSRTSSKPTSRQQSRPATKQGSLGGVAEELEKIGKKPIDFMNLFKNQPDAEFYPAGRKDIQKAASLFSPPKNRSRSTTPLGSPNLQSQMSPNFQRQTTLTSSMNEQPPERGRVRDRDRGAKGMRDSEAEDEEKKKRFTHRKTKKNIHKIRNSLFFGDSNQPNPISSSLAFLNNTPSTGNNGRPIYRNSTSSAVGYLSNEESITLQSSSVESESVVSLANNEYAELPISLNAKTALMNLMVGKTTKLYSSRMQTNQTRQRIALLQGEEISFLSSTVKPRK